MAQRKINSAAFTTSYSGLSYGELSHSFADLLELTQRLVEYRHQPISARLRELRQKRSMLHEDVLLLIYHLSKIGPGNILEIGPYLGGSTIAAALGIRESGQARTVVTVEPGGAFKHPRLSSRNILKDLRKNLAREGVADLVTIVEGYSGARASVSAVHQALPKTSVGLFVIDADGAVERDLNLYRDLLVPNCWLVIDDYYEPNPCGKVARTRPQVDTLISTGELHPLGLYGWGTWVGRWTGATE